MRNRGFSLIEVALILVVVGLVSAGAVQIIGRLGDADKLTATSRQLDRIQKALQIYVVQNRCLPCPSNGTLASDHANAGRSTVAGGGTYTGCTNSTCYGLAGGENGAVPWFALGLSEDDATDAWKSRIRYAVAAGTVCQVGLAGVQATDGMVRCSITSYPAGGISINNLDTATTETTAAAYALVSSGRDRSLALISGGTTTDVYGQTGVSASGQDENRDSDPVLATGSENSSSTTSHFDDITRHMSVPVMIQQCGPGACGNPGT